MKSRSDRVMTVLHSRGRRLCKTIAADGNVSSYDDARTFDMTERTFADLAELRDLLCELSERRDCCAVRGGIADRARTRGVRRLLHADGGDAPTLVDVPRAWLALDIDGMPLPDCIDRRSVFECAMTAINALPVAFRGAGFAAQASTSFGRKPGAHLRLWCVLARAIDGAEASRWVAAIRKSLASVDPACARPAQIVFTATPVFESGGDPIKTRIELLPGGPVSVPTTEELVPPARAATPAMPKPGAERDRYAWAALRNAAARVASGGVGTRHRSLISEARGLARFAAAGALTEGEIATTLRGAAAAAGKTDQAEIDAAISWGFAHASATPIAKGEAA